MPRSGPVGTYSLPGAQKTQVPDTPIPSAVSNQGYADIEQTFNTPTPIAYGGTNGATAVEGGDNLSTKGADIPSATTTDIGASTGRFVHITGTTTITGLGTKVAGVARLLTFDGILTLTHNATSLILPGAANIVTAAGDTAVAVSEGGGNWRITSYERAVSAPPIITRWVAYTPTFTGIGTAAGVKARSRRVGSDLEVEASWQNGTVTGSDFSMTLGFNGVNGTIVCDSFWAATRPVLGPAAWNVDGANTLIVLGLGSSNLVNIAIAASGRNSLTPATGTTLGTSSVINARFSVPIEGWN